MPRPVLSETTFNSDDIATSILQQANLQITNDNLGVSDISSSFTLDSDYAVYQPHYLYFNGFVFVSGYFVHAGTPTNGDVFLTINNADYRPTNHWSLNTIGYQGDTGSRVRVHSNGEFQIEDPTNQGQTTFYIVINGFYHVNF